MGMKERIVEIHRGLIYHGRHFSQKRDETVLQKADDAILALFPSLDDFVVERECDGVEHKYMDSPYSCCNGTGKITRPLTWEDVPHIINNYFMFLKHYHLREEPTVTLPDGGRVRRKEK